MDSTAEASSQQIILKDSVQWPVGSQIVIATTGDNLSQKQSETNYIKNISTDGKTLTLRNPLAYQHLSVKRNVSGVDVFIRAEVGLLSRNVIFNAIDCDISNTENECQYKSDSNDNSDNSNNDIYSDSDSEYMFKLDN